MSIAADEYRQEIGAVTPTISADEYRALFGEPRGNKYGAQRTEIDGLVFDSKAEANRYVDLKAMEAAGIIRDLELQPRFDLVVNGHKICRYTGDFRYYDKELDAVIVEDVKSTATRTRDYVIRKKLVKALHGVDVLEVTE